MSKPIAFVQRSLWLALLVAATVTGTLRAAEVIPAEPTRYFNDYALAVKPETAEKLNQELVQLEQQTSDQILVVIYPQMQTDSSVDDYCLRVFRSWKVGQKDKNNGAVLFVFVQNHKLWIQTGRGLEGDLPDATCKDITADIIAPRLKAGDMDGGLTAGVEAMIAAATKGGDYKGTGQTDYQKQHANDASTSTSTGGGLGLGAIIFIIIVFLIVSRFGGRGGGAGMLIGGALSGLGGGGFGGGGGGFGGSGGGGGGDSGGFSAGGGDTGGGRRGQRLVNLPDEIQALHRGARPRAYHGGHRRSRTPDQRADPRVRQSP